MRFSSILKQESTEFIKLNNNFAAYVLTIFDFLEEIIETKITQALHVSNARLTNSYGSSSI